MTTSNRYIKRSRISEAKFRELVRYFSLDLDAYKITFLTDLNPGLIIGINRYLLLIRKKVAEYCEQSSPFHGEIEVDESYFWAKRVKGKRGRGAYSKTPVFGLLQRGGKVYTEIVPDCARKTLQAIIRGKVDQKALFIPTPGAVIAPLLTWDTKSIIVCIMERMNLPMAKNISRVLNHSGPMQKGDS